MSNYFTNPDDNRSYETPTNETQPLSSEIQHLMVQEPNAIEMDHLEKVSED